MPLRGSVQLLLLFLRRRATRRAGIGAAAISLMVLGAVQLQGTLTSLGKDGLVHALRQSVWERALADQTQAMHWPWQDLHANMSFAPEATVPRLGLSAAMRTQAVLEPASPVPERAAPAKTASRPEPQSDRVQGDVVLSDVAIGDSITFTAADGATCVYRVTGRRVVDPHLAANDAERFDGEAALFECSPLESLIMQATQGAQSEPRPALEAGDNQRKL